MFFILSADIWRKVDAWIYLKRYLFSVFLAKVLTKARICVKIKYISLDVGKLLIRGEKVEKVKTFFMKRLLPILMTIGLILSMSVFSSCGLKSSNYTEKEHLQRVKKRVEERYFSGDGAYEYTDYEIYPVYNENDKLGYFLVEFAPCGFVYIMITEGDFSWIFCTGMYLRDSFDDKWGKTTWSRYKIPQNAI